MGWRIYAFQLSTSLLSKLHFPLFRDLQTTLRLLRYAYLLLDSHIIPSSMLHIFHWNVSIYTIWHLVPYGSSRNPSPYFEARPTTFHTWQFLDISLADCLVHGFRKFQISRCCFMCSLPSYFFPSICNMYTTYPATYIKDLARKWNIYCIFEYIGPSFLSSILDQIIVSFSHLLSLSL